MCHGAIDPKFLMQDAEARLRDSGALRDTDDLPDGDLPPELMGGLRGAWARIARLMSRPRRVHPAE